MAERGRGRPAGFRMDDSHRVKIQNSNILNALIEHVEGKRDMGASQVKAGIALLRKVMPDLTENTHKGDEDAPIRHIIERRIVSRNTGD